MENFAEKLSNDAFKQPFLAMKFNSPIQRI